MNFEQIEGLIEKIELELKAKFNKEANRYGCEINNINIELVGDEQIKDIHKPNIQAIAQKNRIVTDYKMHISSSSAGLVFGCILIMYLLCGYIISNLYLNTNNLMFYFVELLLKDVLQYIPCFGISCIICAILIKSRGIIIIKSLILTILIAFIFDAFVIHDDRTMLSSSRTLRYNYIKVEDEKTSLLDFKYNVLKDVINKQTKTIAVKRNNIFAQTIERSGRKSSDISYIDYKILTEDNQIYTCSSEYSGVLIDIVNYLKSLEEEIVVEYYINSGVIKSIDGIEIFDYEQFEERIVNLTEQKYNKMLNEKKEREEAQKQELENLIKKNAIEYEIKEKAVGKNIEQIKKELDENNIKEYSIKYISSKLGKLNNVIFVDYVNSCFYVIRDNNYEEMVKMPNLQPGMSKENVIKLLQAEGLNYNFHVATRTTDKNKIDTLCTYTYPPGTLVPKGIEVSIGLYTYEWQKSCR